MAYIGTINTDTFNGTIKLPGLAVEELTRPGRNYARYISHGIRPVESNIRTVNYVLSGDLAALEATIAGMRGNTYGVLDSFGRTYSNVLVLSAHISRKACFNGGAWKIRVEVAWTVAAGQQT